MKTQKTRKKQTLEDMERAAWFARLAFGDCSEEVINHSSERHRADDVFHVIP